MPYKDPEKRRECQRRADLKYKSSHREVLRDRARKYSRTHSDVRRRWAEANPEKCKEKDGRYKEKHCQEIRDRALRYAHSHREERRAYRRRTYATKAGHALMDLRCRLWKTIHGLTGLRASIALVGCSPDALRDHIAKQFRSGMTWKNYGTWHVDHKRPCSSFDLTDPEQQKQCFYFTNLRPLWAEENLAQKKSRKKVPA